MSKKFSLLLKIIVAAFLVILVVMLIVNPGGILDGIYDTLN